MNIPVNECSSCGACANICVHNAISMELDNEGFYRPVIDASKCVKCGLCERTCPWINIVTNPNLASGTPKTIAAFAKDESIRLESSSGGIFTVLAQKILNEGGIVAGVAQIKPTRFGHIIIDNKTDLSKLRGSKYVQADVGFVYREIRTLLKSGRKVLFSGTPCQVAALYAVLGSKANTPNLYTVDIVCHGTPSVKVFEKYVKETETENSAYASSTIFRNKQKGWRLFSMTTSLNTISGDHFHFSKTLNKDKFLQFFFKNICLNTSCADCHYAKLPRVADITLGDFWGIEKFHPKMDDNKGTSMVLLNTEHGIKLFDSIINHTILCNSKIEYAIAGNHNINRSSMIHPKRNDFFQLLDNHSLKELIALYKLKPSFREQFFSSIITILWKFYQKLAIFFNGLLQKKF